MLLSKAATKSVSCTMLRPPPSQAAPTHHPSPASPTPLTLPHTHPPTHPQMIYCNAEGLQWVDHYRLVVASDKAKARQPYW